MVITNSTAAAEEMKARGIHWILIRDGDLLADDFSARHMQWGIREAAVANRIRLWHIE